MLTTTNLLKSAAVLALGFALSSATARAANDLTYSLTLTPFTFTGNGTQGGTGTLVVTGPNTSSGLTFFEYVPFFPFPPDNLTTLDFTLGSSTFDLSEGDASIIPPEQPNGHLAANGDLTALNYNDIDSSSSPSLQVGSGVSDGNRSCPSGDICYLFTPASTITTFDSNYNNNNNYCERDCDTNPSTFGVLTGSTTLPTPEPGSLVLFGSILLLVSFSLRKRLTKQ